MPIIIVVIALAVVIAGVTYFSTRSETQTDSTTQTPTEDEKTLAEETIVKPTTSTTVKPVAGGEVVVMPTTTTTVKPTTTGVVIVKAGSYEAYSPEKIALASANGDVVLFFRAMWCPSCRALDADLNANLKNIPANLTILHVDYDNSTDLKRKYGVTIQHTIVQVDKDGTLIKKWLKSLTLAAFIADMNK